MSAAPSSPHAQVVVDLGAIRHNVRTLADRIATPIMVVVKADGYGHGMVEVARAARQAGAAWIGAATAEEALALRAAGDEGRLLCWLAVPGADHAPVIEADIDLAAYTAAQLAEIVADAERVGRVARVHLKIDTGLSRGGATADQWPELVEAAAVAEQAGVIEVAGIWSHLACADEPEHPANGAQLAAFADALAVADGAGLRPEVRHLANSAGALFLPESRYDLVRVGIATYGLSPAPHVASSADLGLVPAMTVQAEVVLTKTIPAGAGVSYGHRFIAEEPMRVALVPLGYGDGVPRHASSNAQVQLAGVRRPVLGRICMDQFMVEADGAEAGDTAVLFGTGADGEPTARDWAEWSQTIGYEIVTRMGGRQTRVHRGVE